jgi:dihydroorotase
VSKGLKGKVLAEIGDMVAEGAVAVSDDGMPIMDAHLMRCALEYCRPLGIPIVVHEEDLDLAAGGVMNEGPVSTRLGLPGLTYAAEDVMVARDIVLAELTDAHVHVAHVSTAGAVRMIREAQARGLHVTTEVTPHHFMLTDEAVASCHYHPDTRMAPPLRSEADRLACIEGLKDGTIAAIATDHAPHGSHEKCVEFELAAKGIVGMETAWGLTMKLVREGHLTEVDAVRLLSSGPCEAFGLPFGSLSVGAAADVAIIDPTATQRVEPKQFESKSANSPFKGWDLPTRIERTIFGGRTVYLFDGTRGEVLSRG